MKRSSGRGTKDEEFKYRINRRESEFLRTQDACVILEWGGSWGAWKEGGCILPDLLEDFLYGTVKYCTDRLLVGSIVYAADIILWSWWDREMRRSFRYS